MRSCLLEHVVGRLGAVSCDSLYPTEACQQSHCNREFVMRLSCLHPHLHTTSVCVSFVHVPVRECAQLPQGRVLRLPWTVLPPATSHSHHIPLSLDFSCTQGQAMREQGRDTAGSSFGEGSAIWRGGRPIRVHFFCVFSSRESAAYWLRAAKSPKLPYHDTASVSKHGMMEAAGNPRARHGP